MRTSTELLTQYAAYHRDRRNIISHFVGVPVIVFAVGVLLARPVLAVAGAVALTPASILFVVAAAWYVTRGNAVLGVAVSAVCPGFTDTDLVARSVQMIAAKTGRSPDAARAEQERREEDQQPHGLGGPGRRQHRAEQHAQAHEGDRAERQGHRHPPPAVHGRYAVHGRGHGQQEGAGGERRDQAHGELGQRE